MVFLLLFSIGNSNFLILRLKWCFAQCIHRRLLRVWWLSSGKYFLCFEFYFKKYFLFNIFSMHIGSHLMLYNVSIRAAIVVGMTGGSQPWACLRCQHPAIQQGKVFQWMMLTFINVIWIWLTSSHMKFFVLFLVV